MAGRAWLVSQLETREYAGNAGYPDTLGSTYAWDSKVPNAAAPEVGDFIVLRNKFVSLGASVIERIDDEPGEKVLYSCPRPDCHNPAIQKRSTRSPRYRCPKCFEVFDEPRTRVVQVTHYVAHYPAAYVGMFGDFTRADLKPLCLSPGSQHSIRELDWNRFRAECERRLGRQFLTLVEREQSKIRGGRRVTTALVRNGQAAFRDRLLKQYGETCAFTGPAPARALDAAHLYSYAAEQEHHEHGGLLLRKDLHHLFDAGLLAVDPTSLRLSCPDLHKYPAYAQFHAASLYIDPSPRQQEWMAQHWQQHRGILA
jgi:hypothetical protein